MNGGQTLKGIVAMRYRSTLTASCAAAVAPMRPHKCQPGAISCPKHHRSLLRSLLPPHRDHPSLRRCSLCTSPPLLRSPLLSGTIGHPACLHRYVDWKTTKKTRDNREEKRDREREREKETFKAKKEETTVHSVESAGSRDTQRKTRVCEFVCAGDKEKEQAEIK